MNIESDKSIFEKDIVLKTLPSEDVLGTDSDGMVIGTPVSKILSGKGTLITGLCTIIDVDITTSSWALAFPETSGTHAGSFTATIANGSVTFTTSEGTSNYNFGYIIYI